MATDKMQIRTKHDRKLLEKAARAAMAIDAAKSFNRLQFYRPYAKQQEFHDLSCSKKERLLMAGNRNGKTYCGAAEFAMHLTGKYPDWWMGRRWNRPIEAWAGSDTGNTCRDIVQNELCGTAGVRDLQGTGMIPRDCVDWDKGVSMARGVADLYDQITVKHFTDGVFDGLSICHFKTYEQGRKKWQGKSIDLIWCDEEPDEDIYSEAYARLGDRDGIIYTTFTPLQGMSKVVIRFLNEPSPDRAVVTMTIDDALHISPENRKKIIDGYLSHEREARANGTPLLGEGRIFMAPEENIREAAHSPLPPHWVYFWGIDFGIGHPFAAVLFGWDRDADILHVIHAFKMKDAKPIEHAASMKPYGPIPVAWPQDGTGRESSGETVASQYKKAGLLIMDEHATFEDGGLSTEAGIMQMDERMVTGKWKVAAHLAPWFEEYRMYHRKKGLIVKLNDDIMSASRIGMMMRRKGIRLPTFDPRGRQLAGNVKMATGLDCDLFG
jgi:phage terminase large subunit-like protein